MSTASDVIGSWIVVLPGDQAKEEYKTYNDQQNLIQKTPWWLISLVFHGAFILMAMMIVVSETLPEEEFTIFEMDVKKFKKPEYDQTLKRDIVKNTKVHEDEIMVESPVITKEDLVIDEIETPNDVEREHKAKGRQEAISTIELGGEGWVGVFGVGGGGSGAYGWRDGGGKRRAVGRGGGSPATESAVDAALRWFKRHQAADGSWSFGKYFKECKDVPVCDHIDMELSQPLVDNASTGFALLCYLGAGHTSRAGKYKTQVINGLAFLEGNRSADGSFSGNNYVNGIATMAAAEAYGMTKDSDLKEMAEKGVAAILARQNEDGYLGWGYGRAGKRSDTSVTGWQVMALKSAKSSGLDIGNAFDGAAAFIEKVTPEIKGDEYEPTMDFVHYQYTSTTGELGHSNGTLTSIGLLCRIFLGQETKGKVVRAHANKMIEDLPSVKTKNFYKLYYCTLAMFQMGDDYWKKWNEALKPALCDTQCMGGCADGSWAPNTNGRGARSGRFFKTAVACLSLEVYYRYLPVSMLK